MRDYIIQKAVSPDKVKAKHRKTLEEYGQSFDAFRKYDGCCAVLCDGTTYSRTGETYQCLDALAADPVLSRFVVIGEAWWPGKDQFSLISGEFRRHAASTKLGLLVHDVLTYAEFDAGFSPVPFRERMTRIPESGPRWRKAEGWEAGTYGCPQVLCNQLADEGGYDGLILRDPMGTWMRGRGTTGEIIKIKRELSFDLRVKEVRHSIGEKTGRAVYSLVVDFNGRDLGVGSGIPHSLADVPTVGSIVEVVAMDFSSDGLLREPRYKGVRFDKTEPDTI